MIRFARQDDNNDAREALPLDPGSLIRRILRPVGPRTHGSGADTIYQAPLSRPEVHWPMLTPTAGVPAQLR